MRHAWTLALVFFVAAQARAHTGGQTVNATFTAPAAPATTPADLGLSVAPFTIATADTSFTVSWEDGDMDPTGRFTFYYLDHQPNFGLDANDIEAIATPCQEVGKSGLVQIYASCTCTDGMGVVCPDAGARDCRASFEWDTSVITQDGAYWLIAVNIDPPYKLYAPSSSPVRVAHGGAALPPAVIVLRPDGVGSVDKLYKTEWLAVGDAPLKIDLAYGSGEVGEALGPTTLLARDVKSPLGPDGTQSYDWDVSKLESLKVKFLRVTVTDASGKVSYSDSRSSLSIYHPGLSLADAAIAADLSSGEPPPDPGCACDAGGRAAGGAGLALVLLAAVGLATLTLRRSR